MTQLAATSAWPVHGIEYWPAASVVTVSMLVRPMTEAPATGLPAASVTVPVTVGGVVGVVTGVTVVVVTGGTVVVVTGVTVVVVTGGTVVVVTGAEVAGTAVVGGVEEAGLVPPVERTTTTRAVSAATTSPPATRTRRLTRPPGPLGDPGGPDCPPLGSTISKR